MGDRALSPVRERGSDLNLSRCFDPERLRSALDAVPSTAWSLPSSFATTGVHHGYRRAALDEIREPFAWVLNEFHPVCNAWLSWIDPGGYIVSHRDGAPWYERWQVPIEVAGSLAHEGAAHPAHPGVPFPVRHWLPHSVTNPTDRPRIHLVIDRDVVLDLPPLPFAVFSTEEVPT